MLQTALHHACRRGHVAVVQQLLKHKASVSLVDLEQMVRGHGGWIEPDLTVVLLGTRTLDMQSALSHAALMGHEAIVALLLQHGANIEQAAAPGTNNSLANPLLSSDHQIGKTPLTLAAQEGRLAVVKQLLAAGANPEFKDSHGWVCSLGVLNHDLRFAELHWFVWCVKHVRRLCGTLQCPASMPW